MTTVSHLLVLIEGDSTSLTTATTKASVATNGFAKTATTSGKTAQTSFGKVGTTAKSVLGGVVPFAAAGAVLAVGQFAAASITAASDNEEALNKVQVIFGDTSASVEEFAENAATSLGLSETAALQAASTFGTMLQAAGYAAGEIDNLSIELATLSADLASFNNIEVTDAIDKIRAGLSGESEPLRAVGVFLTEAKVQAEAYASGIAEVGAELTEGEKIQARYNIILEETANAQGDFARTSDSLANQQRILAAEFQNAQTEIGQKLVPIMKDLVPILTNLAKTVLPALGFAFEGVGKAVGGVVKAVEFLTPGGISDDVQSSLKGMTRDLIDFAKANGLVVTDVEGANTAVGFEVNSIEDLSTALPDTVSGMLGLKEVEKALGIETTKAADGTLKLRDAQVAAAEAARDHRDAVNALQSPMLGLVDSAQQAAEAQEELNRLERLGKTDTAAYSEAVLEALTAQTSLKEGVQAYAQELADSGATVKDVKGSLLDMAEGMGITKEEFKEAFGPISGILEKLKGINALPKKQDFTIGVHYSTTVTGPGGSSLIGGLSPTAAGGIIRAQGGLITRGPTILAGEGTGSTFAGTGAEAVIPLNNRGIGILGEALQRALGMFDVRRSVARETSGRQARDLLQNIRDDLRRSGILDLSALVKLFAKTATPKEAADFRSAMRDSFRESAGRTVFGQAFRDLRTTLANVANDTGRMADKANADRLITNLKQEWRRTGVFDYERLRRAMRADDVPNTVIRDTLTDIHDTLRGQETERSQRLAKAMQDVTNQSGGDFSANRRKMFIEIKPDRRKFTEALKYDTHYGGGY